MAQTFIVAKSKAVDIDKLIQRLKKAKQQGIKKVMFEDHISPSVDPSDVGIEITELGAKLAKAGMDDLADELTDLIEDGPEEYLEDLEDAYEIEEEDLENQDEM